MKKGKWSLLSQHKFLVVIGVLCNALDDDQEEGIYSNAIIHQTIIPANGLAKNLLPINSFRCSSRVLSNCSIAFIEYF